MDISVITPVHTTNYIGWSYLKKKERKKLSLNRMANGHLFMNLWLVEEKLTNLFFHNLREFS